MEKNSSQAAPDGPAYIKDVAELNQPIAFILDVQSRLAQANGDYRRFLDALAKYQEEISSTISNTDKEVKLNTLRSEIKSVLKDHADLYSEFESFFPATSARGLATI
ncbi:hypothetical protein NQ176_g5790 [Zarea fungicola]|uniref:Uncharacterized protein n=1 Tax=Zarea fungicola TaxID=93591 RepID=A0ACC1N785_9HYPO|nr:hypothetical protein NQ176_g5790 [Lecanicillium fungicola]